MSMSKNGTTNIEKYRNTRETDKIYMWKERLWVKCISHLQS